MKQLNMQPKYSIDKIDQIIIPRQSAGQDIIKAFRVCVSVCHVFKKDCTSHWLFLLGLFNVL